MRNLYRIDNGGAVYWVVAHDERDAIVTTASAEMCTGNYETETLMQAEVLQLPEEKSFGAAFGFEGEEETCSVWLAYMIVRDHASTVLACSEWS